MALTCSARSFLIMMPLLWSGCASDSLNVVPDPAPQLISATIGANANNTIISLASLQGCDAQGVAVAYGIADGSSSFASTTPAVSLDADSAIVPVLGLLPEQRYVMRAILFGEGGT